MSEMKAREALPGDQLQEFNYIRLGKYRHIDQNGNYEAEPTDILWLVADANTESFNSYVRLVSEHVLDRRAIDPAAATGVSVAAIYSPLATWLEEVFKPTAFSADELSIMLEYDEVFYSTDENGENYAGNRLPWPGTRVSYVDYYRDGYFNSASRPLGLGGSQASHENMLAAYKNGVPAPYWTGTTTAATYANHMLTETTLAANGSNVVSGVRPMVKLQTNQFTMLGSGTREDPYVIDTITQVEDPVEWENYEASAVIEGNTLTLGFADAVELYGVTFSALSFALYINGRRNWVTTAKEQDGKVVLTLADYVTAQAGEAVLSYSRPQNSYIFRMGTIEYVPSFAGLVVENLNTAEIPHENAPGFAVERIQSIVEKTGVELDPAVPAWGGHQSRIVRTGQGVYLAFNVDVRWGEGGDPSADPAALRRFRLYKIDEAEPVLLGDKIYTGQAINLVADEADNLYVVCLDRRREGDGGYGFPTAYRFTPGVAGYTKLQYDLDETFNDSSYNYEGLCLYSEGTILMALPYVQQVQDVSRMLWLPLDTATGKWGAVHSDGTEWPELYPYVVPKPDGSVNIVGNIGIFYSNINVVPPDGYTFLVNSLTLWNVPDIAADGFVQDWHFELPYQPEYPAPVVQNASLGDVYVDSLDYTHIALYAFGGPGFDTYPMQTRYVVLDEANNVITDRTLFAGNSGCRFVETPDGTLYVLKMTSENDLLEVYRANAGHTDIEDTLLYRTRVEGGEGLWLTAYSGISVSSVRGGSDRAYVVDIAYPSAPAGLVARDWITLRLQLPTE